MAQIIDLFERKTHNYATGYADLDHSVYVGKAKLLPQREVHPGNGYDDMGSFVRYAKLSANIQNRDLGEKALRDTIRMMDGGRCRHEHDCCGCVHSASEVTRVYGRTFKIFTRVMRNF